MFQVIKGSPVGLGMTSRAGGYDERTADLKGKRFVLPSKGNPPVSSSHLYHLKRPVNRDISAITIIGIHHLSLTSFINYLRVEVCINGQKPLPEPRVSFQGWSQRLSGFETQQSTYQLVKPLAGRYSKHRS
jgi:hypothetical protein